MAGIWCGYMVGVCIGVRAYTRVSEKCLLVKKKVRHGRR